jgi:co-chaperonin GroES (HSP10)
MIDMRELKPTGHFVLVEDEVVENVSAGGIILNTGSEAKREQAGMDFGRIIAFGPIAYKDIKGCKTPEDWGVKVGDLIEYSGRYEGKESAFTRENKVNDSGRGTIMRLIPDLSIVSVLEGA